MNDRKPLPPLYKARELYGNIMYDRPKYVPDLIIYDKPKDLSDFYTICPEWDKEVFTAKCDKCQCYSEIYAEYRRDCTVEGEKPITRAPQSWCYVEEE